MCIRHRENSFQTIFRMEVWRSIPLCCFWLDTPAPDLLLSSIGRLVLQSVLWPADFLKGRKITGLPPGMQTALHSPWGERTFAALRNLFTHLPPVELDLHLALGGTSETLAAPSNATRSSFIQLGPTSSPAEPRLEPWRRNEGGRTTFFRSLARHF